MRKNRQRAGDSLEMFLDTICNTFGGILFILLFIVIQLQMAQQSVSEAVSDPVSAVEFDTIKAKWEEKRYELEKLREQIDQFEELTGSLADEEVKKSYKNWQALLLANQDLLDQIAAKTYQVSENDAEAASIAAENKVLLQEVEDLRAQVAEAEASLPDTDEQQPQKLTCPQLSASTKTEIGLIVVFNRLYLWHHYSERGVREGLNTEDFTVLEKSGGQARVFPNPWRGIDLMAEDADQRIGELVGKFSPRECIMAVITAIDSFEQYHTVRDALKKRGFDIEPMVLSLDPSSMIADRGGSGGKDAQ